MVDYWRFTNKDVYVLTSQRTFSGGEEFAYDLKVLKRATIIGEVTGGGAHLVAGRRINDHFMIGVPSARPIYAATNADWEDVGVEPDIKVSAESALQTAHLMALEKREKSLSADTPGPIRAEVIAAIQAMKRDAV